MKKIVIISIIIGCAISPSTLAAQGAAVLNSMGATAESGGLNNFAERATVDVYLTAPNGTPVKGAVVTFITFAGKPYQQLSPNADVAHFGDLTPAGYNVRVIAPGFLPATLQVDAKARHPEKLVS